MTRHACFSTSKREASILSSHAADPRCLQTQSMFQGLVIMYIELGCGLVNTLLFGIPNSAPWGVDREAYLSKSLESRGVSVSTLPCFPAASLAAMSQADTCHEISVRFARADRSQRRMNAPLRRPDRTPWRQEGPWQCAAMQRNGSVHHSRVTELSELSKQHFTAQTERTWNGQIGLIAPSRDHTNVLLTAMSVADNECNRAELQAVHWTVYSSGLYTG